MKRTTMATALAFALWAGTTLAGVYGWNTGSGTWDTTSVNWLGAGTAWVDATGNDALFTNTTAATTITVDASRVAGAVKVGNGANAANFIFRTGTLSASSFRLQGAGASGYTSGFTAPTMFSNLTLTTTGNIDVGHWTLLIGGSSTINVGGGLGGTVSGFDGTWGTLTITNSATVTATNGVNGNCSAWTLNLNGGTLVTKFIQASDRENSGSPSRLTFNGTVIKPTQDTNNFVTVGGTDSLATYSALVGNGGAIFDTDGKNVGITIGLKQSGSGGLTKLGAGTLTLGATNNTYAGATTISNGSLVVSGDYTNGAVSIVNASFETYDGAALIPDNTTNAYRYAPTGASWMFSSQAGITTSNSTFMLPNAGEDGTCAAFLYGTDSFSQSVTVAVAGLYDLRFMVMKGRTAVSGDGITVKIDGTSVCSYAAAAFSGATFSILETKGIALTAGTHTLLFQGLNATTTYAAVIDRVTLTPAGGGSLPTNTAVIIAAAGASYVQGRTSQTIGSLTGVAGSSVSNNGILTVGGNNTNTVFAGVISGAGSLVKAGTGTLTLSGTNTYTGKTTVSAGTLEITAANTLSSSTALELATGAFVKLSNASEQQVATLTFNGVPQHRGTWGAPGGGAEHKQSQFTGAGVLRVLTGPGTPGTLMRVY